MKMTNPAIVVIALSTLFFLGCGGEPEDSADASGMPGEIGKGCEERDGAWFGRRDDGTRIMSQTREACEERL